MAPKKGMSLEDKRQTVLRIFHDTKDVYVLKDIEKLASSRGVVAQSVKDVVKSLVDDDLVHQEKIGASNYLWSFPSEATLKVVTERDRLTKQIKALRRQAQDAAAQANALQEGDADAAERAELEAELAALQAANAQHAAELREHADNDPEVFAALKAAAKASVEGANRWGDNLECLKDWMNGKFEGRKEDVEAFFKAEGATDLEPL
ncbi:unnamed protein product [Pedinophyceae sp. YPF-701]|nr:unnamed protein product [Pedinophyceae sp. YPF-701]